MIVTMYQDADHLPILTRHYVVLHSNRGGTIRYGHCEPVGYPEFVRLLLTLPVLTALIACKPAPQPVEPAKPDLTKEDWYLQATEQLAAMNHEAESLFQRGGFDKAAAIITNGQALQNKLLAVPRPTLGAMEAASDLDDLYGRMLLHNRRYGWARSLFQKNAARWKNWRPQTPETAHRWQAAVEAMAECDRHL
jgi:hypothetical protein